MIIKEFTLLIRKIRTTFRRSQLIQNTLSLLSASVLSQLIAIIVYPLVTRIYTPADLGTMSFFLSIVGILSIVTSGKFESAILTEKEDKDAAAVFDLTFLINLGLSFLLLLILILTSDRLVVLFKIEPINEFIFWIPIGVFITTLGTVKTFWFNRKERFGLTARYGLMQSIANSGSKVGWGYSGNTKWGLIASSLIGPIVGLLSVAQFKKDNSLLYHFDLKRIKAVGLRNLNLFKFTLPHSLINSIAGNLPILILTAWFNMTEVGLFSLAITLGFRPISLITSSISQVLFQKVSNNLHQGISSYTLIRSFCKQVLFWGIPIVVLIGMTVRPVTTWLFGENWLGAANYLLVMLPWFFVSMIGSSICFMSVVANKQKQAMIFEVIYTISRGFALFVGVWIGNAYVAVFLYSIISTLYVLIVSYWYLKLSKNLI